MNLIIVSPEVQHDSEIQIYSKILFEPRISHIHIRRKHLLSEEEWQMFKPFARKIIFSESCGKPPYHCKGIHGNSANNSMSTHNLVDALNCDSQYCYISPIYPSISKKGYHNGTLLAEIMELTIIPKNWVALGGISTENLSDLAIIGFSNAAVLGSIWDQPNPLRALDDLLNTL